MDKITVFVNRLQKLGIKVRLVGNYPWIYLDSVNGNRVNEKFQANHGFTIAFLPIKKDQELHFTDICETFKIIRKYRKFVWNDEDIKLAYEMGKRNANTNVKDMSSSDWLLYFKDEHPKLQ